MMMTARTKMFLLTLVAIVLLLIRNVNCYSSGAPPSACEEMLPAGHIVPAQNGLSPFGLNVSIASQGFYNINLGSDGNANGYKGFMIQAYGSDNEGGSILVGTFVHNLAAGVQTMDCGHAASTVTHIDRHYKSHTNVLWFPGNYRGSITFKATVVEDFFTFYTDISASYETV